MFFKSSWVTLLGHPLGSHYERKSRKSREWEIQEAPGYVAEEEMYPTNPYPVSCQGSAFALAPGVCARNVELGTHTGAWHCGRLLCRAPSPSDRATQIHRARLSLGKAGQACQKEAKRDFLGTQARLGATLAYSESQWSWHKAGFSSGVGSLSPSPQKQICV